MTIGLFASATTALFSPEIYSTLKVYWLENPQTLIEDMTKILDRIEAGIKTLEEHEQKQNLGGDLQNARVAYCTPKELRKRLAECRKFYFKYRLQLSKDYPKNWMFVVNGDLTLVKRIKGLADDIKGLEQDYMATSSIILYDEQDPELFAMLEDERAEAEFLAEMARMHK